MNRIVLVSANSLCHNPRVFKEAAALAEAGFKVNVLGAWSDPALKERDQEMLAKVPFQFTPVLDLTSPDAATRARKFTSRLRTKLGALAFRHFGIENSWQLGPTAGALSRVARRQPAGLFIAHSEAALWAISKLRAPRLRLGVDMEDWFSEDLLPEARKQRPLKMLRSLERGALRQSAHSTCTSRAMSEALAKDYGCRPPVAVYNAFPWADRRQLDGQLKDRPDRRVPSIHWYSQTLGHGRGLEDLFDALPQVQHEAEVHLRGRPVAGFRDWLAARLPEVWRPRVFVHDLVSNNELLSRIAEHDIGFAGEQKYCRSRDLTVTNKILHYLLGGLAVVASDTLGQREVAEQSEGAVKLCPVGNAAELAGQLNQWLGAPKKLLVAKAAALRAAERTWCWERQVPSLLGSVTRAAAAD